jgi:hypothetical protein
MSMPRRIPLPMMIGLSPCTASAILGRTAMAATVPSSARPARLETCTAEDVVVEGPPVLAQRPLLTRAMGDEHVDSFRQVLPGFGFKQIGVDDVEVLVDAFARDGERLVLGFIRYLSPRRPDHGQRCRDEYPCAYQPQHVSTGEVINVHFCA